MVRITQDDVYNHYRVIPRASRGDRHFEGPVPGIYPIHSLLITILVISFSLLQV